ncbi:MAG: M48 family metalloprotease [Gammaproteobacteria bacterium]|nr:M48 family metalloprotease [Gammaproteobacteria bacterium]
MKKAPPVRTFGPGSAQAGLLGLLMVFSVSDAADAYTDVIDDSDLPSVGEPADRVMTQAEEARIKRFLKAQLYGHLPVSEDPESNAYLRALGDRILSRTGITQEFDLLIVRNRQVNAFAMPGGLLAFYTGLITKARNESELAGVVAHEMAHVTQRHLARMQDHMTSSNLSLLTMAGVILAGVTQTSALLPAAVLGQAVEQQRFLNYSRANEQEADRFASRFLAKSGIDPNGVANFFEVLLKRSDQHYGKDFEYLSTHPTTPSRIVEARDRARQYQGTYLRDSERFRFIRQRMISLQTPAHERLELFQSRLDAGHRPDAAEQYGAAVAWQKHGDHAQALDLLRSIQVGAPELRLLLDLAIAESRKHLDQLGQALETLERLHRDNPAHAAVEFYLAQAYLAGGQPGQALKLVRKRIRRGIRTPQTYRLLAEAANATGQPVISHIALADHYLSKGQLRQAANQLDIAEKHAKANSANQARIDHRRTEIRTLAREFY